METAAPHVITIEEEEYANQKELLCRLTDKMSEAGYGMGFVLWSLHPDDLSLEEASRLFNDACYRAEITRIDRDIDSANPYRAIFRVWPAPPKDPSKTRPTDQTEQIEGERKEPTP